MKVIRVIFMVLLSLILILSLLGLGLQFSFSPLLKLEYYEDVLEESGVYGIIEETIKSQISQFVELPTLNLRSEAEKITITLVSGILSYVKGESETIDLTITIDTDKIKKAFFDNIKAIPNCTTEEETLLLLGGNSESLSFQSLSCKPSYLGDEEALDLYLEESNINLEEFQSFDLAKDLTLEEDLKGLRAAVYFFNLARILLIILVLIVLTLMWISSIKKESSALHYASFSFLFSGILLLISKMITSSLFPMPLDISVDAISLDLSALQLALINPILSKILFFGILLIFIGIILFAASFAFKTKKEVEKKEVAKLGKKDQKK